ncbi:MAG: hypothetical protein Q8Q09_08160, partial [Deltaproteobacteria bacterium]|nr:hypothetical protein [Deltaproteobacteria bacterium]
GQWWQLRFSRITERRLRMHWSGYLRDIEGSTPYDLLIVDGQIRADPELRIRGFVADAPYEGHTFSGGLTLRDGVLDLDITSSRQYLPQETRQLERRRLFCRATRNRP